MSALIPPYAVYVGLAACVLALLVATAQNKWSPKVFFLLALRIAIGWHFMFEGFHKIHSHMVGPTDSNKVFSSEPYFSMAEGPLGPIMRKRIGDPAELIKQRIVSPVELPKTKELESKQDSDYLAYVPAAVKTEWEEYVAEFNKIHAKDKPIENKLSNEILANYGKWIAGVEPGKESKIRYFQTDVPYTVKQRLEHLDKVEKYVAELQERQNAGLGHGYGYDQSRMTAAKAELRSFRTDLLADADSVITDMKKELFARSAGLVLSQFEMPSKRLQGDQSMQQILNSEKTKDKPSFETAVPTSVKDLWTEYLATMKKVYADYEVKQAKSLEKKRANRTTFGIVNPPDDLKLEDWADFPQQQLADWFAGPGQKLIADVKAAGPDKAKSDVAKKALLDELDKRFVSYRAALNNAIPADALAGIVEVKKEKPIERMDKFTMWFIAIVGACIMFGFLTPVACLAAVVFLVMTYLTHPPFPWLPLPPNTEGNPLYINKNVIEALALLVIAVHPTGRWLGLDALWTWMFGVGVKKDNA